MRYPYDGVDLRKHPEAYRIGRGEQGVFYAEPYKSELLPLWGFKDVEAAKIFYEKWRQAAEDEEYLKSKEEHRNR